MNISEKNQNIIRYFFSFLIIFIFVLIVSSVIDVQKKLEKDSSLITVSGYGEAYVVPDTAVSSFSVISEAKSIEEAMKENVTKMNAIIASLKEKGMEEKDIKTTSFNVYPRYEWEKFSSSEQRKRILAGYEVNQTISVKTKELDRIGEIIKTATENGANTVSGPTFIVDNIEKSKSEARLKAIKNAKEKAELIASSLGLSVSRVVDFSESNYLIPRYSNYYDLGVSESKADMSIPEPNIMPGENRVSINVSISFELK